MWIELKWMNEIKIYEIIVIGKEFEVIRDRSIGYEYESISRLHYDELLEASSATIFAVVVLSESGTLSDRMSSSGYTMFSRLTRMLYPESVMRSRSPIGYDRIVSSRLADTYRESLGAYSSPCDISYIIRITIGTQM
jgi:hypothetical protein